MKFDAKEIAARKDAGMKYIVITAKHHDGFAMYIPKRATSTSSMRRHGKRIP